MNDVCHICIQIIDNSSFLKLNYLSEDLSTIKYKSNNQMLKMINICRSQSPLCNFKNNNNAFSVKVL